MRRLVVLSAILALESCGLLVGTNETYSNAPDASVTSDAAAPTDATANGGDASGPSLPSSTLLQTRPIAFSCTGDAAAWHLDCTFGQDAGVVVVADDSVTAPRSVYGDDGYVYTLTSPADGGYALTAVSAVRDDARLVASATNEGAPIDFALRVDDLSFAIGQPGTSSTTITTLTSLDGGREPSVSVVTWNYGPTEDTVASYISSFPAQATLAPIAVSVPVTARSSGIAGTYGSYVGAPADGGPATLFWGALPDVAVGTYALDFPTVMTSAAFASQEFWVGGSSPAGGVLEWGFAPSPALVEVKTPFPITQLEILGSERAIAIGPPVDADGGQSLPFETIIAEPAPQGNSTMLAASGSLTFDAGLPATLRLAAFASDLGAAPSCADLDASDSSETTGDVVLVAGMGDGGTLQLVRLLVQQCQETVALTPDPSFGTDGRLSISLGSSFVNGALTQIRAGGDSYVATIQLAGGGAVVLVKIVPPATTGSLDAGGD